MSLVLLSHVWIVFIELWMTTLVAFEQLNIFYLCLNSFLLSHIWMTILVVFEQLSIFRLCLNSFLLSHVWMTILVVFEQLSIFRLCLNSFLLSHVWMTILRCTHGLKPWYWSVFRLTIFYVLSIRARMTIILVMFKQLWFSRLWWLCVNSFWFRILMTEVLKMSPKDGS